MSDHQNESGSTLGLPSIYWCKRRDGTIVEHVTTAYEGHRSHVRCVTISAERTAP